MARLIVLTVIACAANPLRASAESTLHARVIVGVAGLYAGPRASARRIAMAHRGDDLPIKAQSSSGTWLQVELSDGRRAWVATNQVHSFHLDGPESGRPLLRRGIFDPTLAHNISMELAVAGGVLGRNSFVAFRPAIVIRSIFAVELTAAASISSRGRLFLGGLGGMINFGIANAVVPFLVLGGGIAQSNPNGDAFLSQPGSAAVTYGGGGLRLGFGHGITVRLDARAYVLFEADAYEITEEVSGGFTALF